VADHRMKVWRAISPTGKTLLVGVFLTGLTTYMFLPLLALQLTSQGLAAPQVGLVVGVLAFSTQAFALLAGFVADRYGARLTITFGLGLRIAGYLLLAIDQAARPAQLALPLIAVTAIGVGGSLLGIAIKAQLADEPGVAPRRMLALRSTFINAGVICGPALGALASGVGFALILACCVASHLLLGVKLLLTARPDIAVVDETAPGNDVSIGRGFSRTAVSLIVLSSMAYWVLYSQVNLSLPLVAEKLTGQYYAISVLFTINGVAMVLCQYFLLGHVFKGHSPVTLLMLGFAAFSAAFVALVFATGWLLLVVFVLLATLAEIFIGPSLDEQAIRRAPVGRRAFVLGAVAAAGASGSLAGSSFGGYLYQRFNGSGSAWIAFVFVALAGVGINLTRPVRRVSAPP
jgi:MFS family permease